MRDGVGAGAPCRTAVRAFDVRPPGPAVRAAERYAAAGGGSAERSCRAPCTIAMLIAVSTSGA